MPTKRPVLNDRFESNVPGLYIVGDLAGAPVIKLAMEQGLGAAREIIRKHTRSQGDVFDVLVIGAGAAGLNAALEIKAAGLRVLVIDKGPIGNTVAELPEGKWIYLEPEDRPAVGRLSVRACSKEELIALWRRDIARAGLEVREHEAVESLARRDEVLVVETQLGSYRARFGILATGKQGEPRRLGIPGEDTPALSHKLSNPALYRNEEIVVVGGGNTAAEAALALADQNRVVLIHRGTTLDRLTREHRRGIERSSVKVLYNTEVRAFRGGECVLSDGTRQPFDHAFVLIGSDLPTQFLRSLGVRLENEWTWRRWAALLCTLAVAYTIYGAKQSPGHEFWPFTGWGFQALSFFNRPWSFWYTVLYTAVVTVFGVGAMKRWGWNRKDRFQTWRYTSLIAFQWIFFFLIPEFLFQWAVRFQWVGEKLAHDPGFAQNAWRSYGIVYAWPLFFYTFFGSPHQVWIVWGVVLSFVLIPMLVLFHGKRYCSWICGCGGLAETLGDRWRHLAPKGPGSIRWERMNAWVLGIAVVLTAAMLGRDVVRILGRPADAGLEWYHLIVDTWLVGIIPVAAYPFFGGKVWCRYWCPLAKLMELWSAAFTRFRASRFAIRSNEKCISCGECTRYCQVGIDVMRYAERQADITNSNSSCIGCGICVTVCPLHVLSFARPGGHDLVQIRTAAAYSLRK